MKADNLMSASLAGTAQNAGVKAQNSVRTVEKADAANASEGKNSFDDALQTAQTQKEPVQAEQTQAASAPQEPQEPVTAKPETDATAQETEPGKVSKEAPQVTEKAAAAEEEKPQAAMQSMPLDAMLLALSGNNQPVLQAVAADTQLTETAPQLTQQTVAEMPQTQELMPQLNSLEALLPSQNQALNNDVTLQTLLPQNGQADVQNRQGQQLMNMLAGNNAINTQLTEVLQPQAAQAAQATEQVLQQAITPEAVMPQVQELSTQQPLQATQVAAANVETLQAMTQETAPATVENKADTTVGDLQKLFGDAVLTVDNQTEQAQPQVDVRAQLQQQNRQSQPQQTTGGQVITQRAQLPGEAAFTNVSVTAKEQETVPAENNLAGATLQQPLAPQNTVAENAEVPQAQEQQPQVDRNDVMQQIVQQARLVRAEDGNEMVIKLEPQYLGELTMRIAVKGDGTVNATFLADNAQTRSILQGSLIELKQQLEAQGMKVDNVEVGAQLNQDFFANSEAGQQGYPYQQSGSARNEAALRSAFADDADNTSEFIPSAGPTGTDVNHATDDGVDYRI